MVSLPESVLGSPSLRDALDPIAKDYLEAGQERMLRSHRDRADILKREGPVRSNTDPLLVRNRRATRGSSSTSTRGLLRYTCSRSRFWACFSSGSKAA